MNFPSGAQRGPRPGPIAAALLAAALAACVNSPSYIAPPQYQSPPDLEIPMVNGAGTSVARAALWETPHGVYFRLSESGALPVGWHGLHLHEKGDCSAADFTSAGAHIGHAVQGPNNERLGPQHGLMNPAGPEPGDLPNFFKPPFDLGAAEFFTPYVTLAAAAQDGRVPLRGPQGAALVMHENPDDHLSQPIGGAGPRIACGVIPPIGAAP